MSDEHPIAFRKRTRPTVRSKSRRSSTSARSRKIEEQGTGPEVTSRTKCVEEETVRDASNRVCLKDRLSSTLIPLTSDEDEEGASDIESRIEVDALLTSMKRSLNFSIRSNVTTSTGCVGLKEVRDTRTQKDTVARIKAHSAEIRTGLNERACAFSQRATLLEELILSFREEKSKRIVFEVASPHGVQLHSFYSTSVDAACHVDTKSGGIDNDRDEWIEYGERVVGLVPHDGASTKRMFVIVPRDQESCENVCRATIDDGSIELEKRRFGWVLSSEEGLKIVRAIELVPDGDATIVVAKDADCVDAIMDALVEEDATMLTESVSGEELNSTDEPVRSVDRMRMCGNCGREERFGHYCSHCGRRIAEALRSVPT